MHLNVLSIKRYGGFVLEFPAVFHFEEGNTVITMVITKAPTHFPSPKKALPIIRGHRPVPSYLIYVISPELSYETLCFLSD